MDESLKSRERLPPFWRPTSNHHPHCFGSSNQPLIITDSRPLAPLPSDPYLSPNPYSTANNPLTNNRESITSVQMSSNTGQPPYLYDYSCLRPTPYHTTSYDYEQDLPSLDTTANNSTILECDSGYGEELSYYYSTPTTTPSVTNSRNTQQQPSSPTLIPVSSSTPSQTQVTTGTSSQFLPSFSSSQSQQISNSTERQMTTDKSESETDSDSSSGSSPPPGSSGGWSGASSKDVVTQPPPSVTPPFAQQDSQCGMESRRSTNLNFSSHSMPLDNLISSSYLSSL